MCSYDGKLITPNDFDFDLKAHRRRLTDLLSSNIIKKDSSEFDDFWKFADKLQNFILHRSKRASWNAKLCLYVEFYSKAGTTYDRALRLNLQTKNYRIEDYMRHRLADSRRKISLTDRNLICTHLMFDMYLDFVMKQKWARLKKLHRDRLNLPIASFREPLLNKLSNAQVLVVAGDTGCGKSTQVPQFLAAACRKEKIVSKIDGSAIEEDAPIFKRIAVTQPRKIACISLAARVSTEMLSERGTTVGYQVRFERHKSKATRILFLTEGLLLRQMQSDPFLKEYDAIVLDEVHERHWQTDCLLGLMKCLVLARPDLRLVLMSATINVNLFADFFDSCPIIQIASSQDRVVSVLHVGNGSVCLFCVILQKVPGRLYPISLKYCPLTPAELAASHDRIDPAPYVRLLQHIDSSYPCSEKGDLLVFLPGMAEIQSVMEACKSYAEHSKQWIVLPLHSALPASSQEKIFHVAPDGIRKCVLATNIAETSVTIDGIRFVADSGRVKELTWDALSRMRRLKETDVSQASADQRKGRAGRTGPGVCFRFFKEDDYMGFQRFTTPEIQRVPLDILVLQMMSMGLPDIKRFPFIESPESKSIDEAIQSLVSHGALTREHTLTPLGNLLADLPVDLSLGRMLIMASVFQLVEPVLSLAVGLAVQNPISAVRNGEGRLKQTEALQSYESNHGTPFMVANLFDEWLKLKSEAVTRLGLYAPRHSGMRRSDHDDQHGRVDAHRWCVRLKLEEQRLYEMVRLRSQFIELLRQSGLYGGAPLARDGDPSGKGGDKVQVDHHHKKALRQAQHRMSLQTKRRRQLSLQDNADEDEEFDTVSGDDDDGGNESVSLNSIQRLHSWLTGTSDSSNKRGRLSCEAALVGTGLSVRDLELLLCHNLEGLADSADLRKQLSKLDNQLLKVIMVGGLYPQLAVPDPANGYRVATRGGAAGPGAEMLFHTPTKPFVMLQPTDVFVRQPDCLFPHKEEQSTDAAEQAQHTDVLMNEKKAHGHKPLCSQFSHEHQILAYFDLIETTKPFLVNTIRVPALPTLLLYSREIDTNSNVTRIIFDRWIEVNLLDPEAAQRSLAAAVWIRTCLERLLKLQLHACQAKRLRVVDDSGFDENKPQGPADASMPAFAPSTSECRRLQRMLAEKLTTFVSKNATSLHSLKKLHAADIKKLYSNDKSLPVDVAEVSSDTNKHRVTMHPEKGGYQVTSYLTVNCLHTETPPAKKFQEGNSDDDEAEEQYPSALDGLELALRLHKIQASALEAGIKSELTEDYLPADDFEKDAAVRNTSEDCPKCGKTLPKNPTPSQLLVHNKHCIVSQK